MLFKSTAGLGKLPDPCKQINAENRIKSIDKNLSSNIVTINAKATFNIPNKIIPNRRIHKPHTRIPMGNRTRNVHNVISSRNHSKITSHRPFHKRNRTRNNNNLIKIYPNKNLHNTGVNALSQNNPSHVPKVMVTNVRSLVPKLDEVQEFLIRNDINFAFITETWLKESIAESIINIPGYTVFRRDRKNDDHGGVCAYIRTEKCNYRRMDELNCCENHEILWLYLRPDRLPRGFSCIIAGLVYHPPSGNASSICDHLFNSLTMAESKYPNCGILVRYW